MRLAVYDIVAGAAARLDRTVTVAQVGDLAACDVVVLCRPAPHAEVAAQLLGEGVPVVSIGDDLGDLRALLQLDHMALHRGVPLVIGAGMAPGLSGLLARHLASELAVIEEVHVAIHGTAGPACARQHHNALGDAALGWHDDEWIEPPGGTGRDLVWFPEPVGAHDCYRAAVGDPLLLQRAFPSVTRISARVSATRRDRLTARLPMLTPPHASGDLGSVRVELRGALEGGARHTVIAGAAALTAVLAAAVCAAAVVQVVAGHAAPGAHAPGDLALDPLELLHVATQLGVQVQEFTGVARATSW
jgi:hypothetical protein